MVATRARVRLVAWLKKYARSQAWLAERCGVKQSSVSLWLRGLSRPEPPLRKVVEAITGIGEDDWLTAAERAQRDRLLQRATGTEDG